MRSAGPSVSSENPSSHRPRAASSPATACHPRPVRAPHVPGRVREQQPNRRQADAPAAPPREPTPVRNPLAAARQRKETQLQTDVGEPKSCRNPGSVSGSVRAAPPGSASASKTSTLIPACASAMAAASPLGPDPITHARLIANPFLQVLVIQSCGGNSSGHSTTANRPSAAIVNSGAYSPRYSRRHQSPVRRFSPSVVNQYCQITARTYRGGVCAKGFPRKSASTSPSPTSRRSSVSGTISFSRQPPSDANHRFQSKRG